MRCHSGKYILVLILFAITMFIFFGGSTKTKEFDKKNEYIEMGKKLYSQKDYYGAIDMWKEALAIDPWDEDVKALIQEALEKIEEVSANLQKGLELLESGNYEEAYEILKEVQENVSPGDERTLAALEKGFRRIEEERRKLRFKKLVSQGDEALEDMKLDEAERFYTEARKLYPESPVIPEKFALLEGKRNELKKIQQIQALLARGAVLYEQEELEKARGLFEEVLTLDPQNKEAKLYLSKIAFKEREKEKLLLQAKNYYETGKRFFEEGLYREAIEQFLNSIAMNYRSKEAREYIEKAKLAIEELRKKENERIVEQVSAFLREGIKYYNLNQNRKALEVLNKALQLDPENSQVKEYILRASIALKREEERSVPKTSPFYRLVETLKRLGLEAYRKGRYDESIKYWEEILLIFPYNEEAKLNLTKVLSKADPALAAEILKNLYSRAESLFSKNRKKEAEETLMIILSVDPNYSKAKKLLSIIKGSVKKERVIISEEQKAEARKLYKKGVELYSEEKLEEAIELWKKAIKLDPSFLDARVYLAKAETELRNLQRAAKLRKETEVASSDIHLTARKYYLDGISYYLEGLYEEAISEWEKALEIEPENERIKMNIKRAKERLEYVTQRKG